jgi:putative ABC transport system ATP-binding protein
MGERTLTARAMAGTTAVPSFDHVPSVIEESFVTSTMTSPVTSAPPAVVATEVTKVYGAGDAAVHALRRVSIGFATGAFTAIMGPSGSGKSTLMHCLAGLDTVDRGSVTIGQVDITRLSDRQLTRLRRDRIGFVFQSFNLLPTLTAEQNMLLPLELAGRRPDPRWVDHIVATLGLRDRLRHRPSELSGGQQQRVACARALLHRPEVIFADEPTGNLDSRSGTEVLGFLRSSVREMGQTIVMVTHDPVAASYADRVVFLRDGRITAEMFGPTPDSVLDALKKLES